MRTIDNTQRITLDIRDNQTYEQIYLKQYNKGFPIEFEITKNGEPFDLSNTIAVFELKKPDGTTYIDYCDITNNIVSIEVDEQMTSANGKGEFQITFYDLNSYNQETKTGDVVISTVIGIMKIDKSAVQNEDIESSDVFNLVTEVMLQISEIQLVLQETKELVNEAKEYSTSASTSASISATSASNAKVSEDNAKISENNSKVSEENSKTSEDNAKVSETNAANDAQSALEYSTLAKSYTIGGTDTRTDEDTDNAKYYYERTRSLAESCTNEIISVEEPVQEVGDFWLSEY